MSIPAPISFIPHMAGGTGIPRACGDPGGLGQMSLRPSAIWLQIFDRFVKVAALLAQAVRRLLDRDWRAPDMAIEQAEISLSFRSNLRRTKAPPARITYAELGV